MPANFDLSSLSKIKTWNMLDENTYAYKSKLYGNKTSLEYIIKVNIEYMVSPIPY